VGQVKKQETVEEFLARGGKVERLPTLYGSAEVIVDDSGKLKVQMKDGAKFSQWKMRGLEIKKGKGKK
jgi:hypothetical protein